MRILPDGLTGSIMAVEGISDAAVMLHGPGGCRVRHMVLSTAVFPREGRGDPFVPYFYGYPRVPATYLDEYDFINGACYKSEEGLSAVASTDPSLIVVIDSPGAALIGDDHDRAIDANGLAGRAMRIGESMASMPATTACGRTLAQVMDFIAPARRKMRKGAVNLLGLSLMDKDWKAAKRELVGYLEDMGLEVIASPGAGSSVDELIGSADAEFNVVVCPEMCAELVRWYEGIGVPAVCSEAGAPVGFDATEAWIRAVAEATGRDPTKPLRRVAECRESVFEKLAGIRYNALRIRGLTFSAAGTASVVRPLTEWLYSYLAMVPEAIAVDDGADEHQADALRFFLGCIGSEHAWGREPVPCGVVLCEGVQAATMELADQCRAGIPVGYSSMGLDDIIPRPVYGCQGALYILDEIMHGVRNS